MFNDIMRSLDKEFNKGKKDPSNMDLIYYTFWEKGISLNEFNELPIPYILGIMNSIKYVSELQKKEMKKK